jgi:DNA-binding MarR family transcriptional regulator
MRTGSRVCYEEFVVLNFIDIKYSVPFNLIIDVLGRNFKNVKMIVEKLVKEGYVKKHKECYSLTKLGKERVKLNRREIVNGLTNEERQLLKEVGNILCDLSYFLQYTITKFQLKADSQKDIISSIEEIHNETALILEKLLQFLPHFKLYLDRLEESLSKIRDGNILFIVYEPNSYYYVFYEMHADVKNFILELE